MSSNSLARLSVELAANTAAFQGDMGKAARIAEKEMSSIKDAAGKMGVALAAGLTAAGAAFAAMAKDAINSADEMNDMSSRVGMSVESLSALSYAAKMSGADTQVLAAGMQKLNSNVVDAARGQGAAKDAFAALGISVKGANGEIKSSETIMREVADKFAGFEDGAAKSAMAVDIFGKSGADLIPMLNEGTAGIDAMRAEAEAMGQVMSGETAAGAAAVNDNIDQMKLMMGGAVNQVTAGMLPTFASLTEVMKRTAQDTDLMRSIADGLSVAFKALVSVAMGVKAAFSLVGDSIGKVMAAIAAAARGDFQAAKDILFDTSASASLSDSLTNIRDLWVGVTAEANQASTAQQKAMGSAPAYAGKGGTGGGKGKGKGKGASPAMTGAQWDGALDMSIEQWAAEEEAKQQAILQKQREGAAQQIQVMQQGMMSKRMLEMQDFNQKKAQLDNALQLEVIDKTQRNALMEDLERQHKARIKEMDDAEVAQKKANQDRMINFVGNGLAVLGAKHKAAAIGATLIQNREALRRIAIDTRTMAVGAYNAMVGIPFVGPALAVVAAGAAIAFGAAQAAALGGGIGGAGNASAPSAPVTPSAASSIEPAYARDDLTKKQTTVLQLPANRMMTGRDLAEWLDEALGDGAQLTNLRVMAV